MKIASSLVIVVGLVTFSLAVYGRIANVAYEAALGVFLMVLGLLGFMTIRMAKLEQQISELKKTK